MQQFENSLFHCLYIVILTRQLIIFYAKNEQFYELHIKMTLKVHTFHLCTCSNLLLWHYCCPNECFMGTLCFICLVGFIMYVYDIILCLIMTGSISNRLYNLVWINWMQINEMKWKIYHHKKCQVLHWGHESSPKSSEDDGASGFSFSAFCCIPFQPPGPI
jgi:hypothetical protein